MDWKDFYTLLKDTFTNPVVYWTVVIVALCIAAIFTGLLRDIGKRLLDKLLDRWEKIFPKPAPPDRMRRPTVSHMQLPPAHFVGRGKELRDLRKAIGSQNLVISGVLGTGGIGKTALARKLCAELGSLYPDAHIEVDLLGTTAPLSPERAMERVIRAFDPNYKTPGDPKEALGHYLNALSGKRVLLLMDNAGNAAQVAPLIPPPGNLMVVTSRRRFTLDGCFFLDLDVLPLNKSEELLLALCPRIDKRAAEIADVCGHLPLALRLAGGALAARGEMTVGDYLARVKTAGARLSTLDKWAELTNPEQTITGTIETSFALLSAELQKRWIALSVFAPDFDSAAAGAVWAVEANAANEALGDLRTYSLVNWDEEGRRYRLHDLARDFAASRLGDCPPVPNP